MQLQGMAQVMHRLVDFGRPVMPAQRTLADVDAHPHALYRDRLLGQRLPAGVGDGVVFFPALGVAEDQFAFFKESQGWIDNARTGAVGAIEHAFDLADQVIAMARLFGNQREQQQFQVAGGKYAWSAAAAFPARTFFETVAAVTVFSVGMMGVITHASHVSFSCVS